MGLERDYSRVIEFARGNGDQLSPRLLTALKGTLSHNDRVMPITDDELYSVSDFPGGQTFKLIRLLLEVKSLATFIGIWIPRVKFLDPKLFQLHASSSDKSFIYELMQLIGTPLPLLLPEWDHGRFCSVHCEINSALHVITVLNRSSRGRRTMDLRQQRVCFFISKYCCAPCYTMLFMLGEMYNINFIRPGCSGNCYGLYDFGHTQKFPYIASFIAMLMKRHLQRCGRPCPDFVQEAIELDGGFFQQRQRDLWGLKLCELRSEVKE